MPIDKGFKVPEPLTKRVARSPTEQKPKPSVRLSSFSPAAMKVDRII
jgi:hypothetical protein